MSKPIALAALVTVALLLPPEGKAQTVPLRDPAALPAVASPGTAFVRALIVPGWGHASLRSYTRGGFYFLLEGLTAYGVLRTQARIGEVRRRLDFREAIVTEDLLAQGVAEQELEDALADNAVVADLRGLLASRENQREDLLAFGVFLVFLSGVDAYVSGHLANFPEPLELDARPVDRGGMEVSLQVAVPR